MEQSAFGGRPDYRVDILARRNRVTVSAGDQVLADSERCLLVDEQDHGLVFYFPPTTCAWISSCPTIGPASARSRAGHLSSVPPRGGDVFIWSYEDPFAEVARLGGYVAFFQDAVDLRVGVATPAVSGR